MRQRFPGWTTAVATATMAAILARPGAARAEGAVAASPWPALVPDIVVALAALVLACAGVWVLVTSLRRSVAGGFWFRRHASGFGGSSTGWQASDALVRAACGLALVVLAVFLAMARVPVKDAAAGEGREAAKPPVASASVSAAAASGVGFAASK